MSKDNLVSLALAAKQNSLPEHTLRRRLANGEISGEKLGRERLAGGV